MKTNPMKQIIGASALAAVLAFSTAAHAQLSSQLGILDLSANGGINPATGFAWQQGDKYHLIYVTTGTTAATSTEIADYNAFVQADAVAEGMGGANWFVMGSTATTNAINNAVITGPVMNVTNSATVATDAADFWNLNFSNTSTPKTLAGENKNLHTGTQGGGTVNNALGGTSVRLAWTGWANWNTTWRAEPATDLKHLLAISQELTVSGPDTSFLLYITPNAETPGSYDLAWESQAGKLYNLRTSTDLTGAISTWTLVEGAIEATPPTNVRTVAPADEKRFYAVEQYDAPPPGS